MIRRAPLVALLALAGTAGAAYVASSAFLGAPAGVAVSFTHLTLPNVKLSPARPLPPNDPEAFTPAFDQLLYSNTVITTEAQFKKVWSLLYAEPYDATLVDFDSDFVVLMGGGAAYWGFDIQNVEQVDAKYSSFGFGWGGGDEVDKFLSISSFEFIPGVQPQDPPLGNFRVSGVRIRKVLYDDCVFHHLVAFGV